MLFSLASNIIFSDKLKVLVLKYLEKKDMVFLSQRVYGNMIFTDYWKVLVLTFSEMGNTICYWAKRLTEIWHLLITEKFLFWTFRWWKIRPFLTQEVDGKMIFTGYWEVLVLNIWLMENTVFFQPKSWWKDDIYMVFFIFLWYSRTWEIWFLAWFIVMENCFSK